MSRKIAERRFALGGKDNHLDVVVFEPIEDQGDYRCCYEIKENGEILHQSHALGVDSLQALILALQKLGADIVYSDHAKNKRLYWNSQNKDLGVILPKEG